MKMIIQLSVLFFIFSADSWEGDVSLEPAKIPWYENLVSNHRFEPPMTLAISNNANDSDENSSTTYAERFGGLCLRFLDYLTELAVDVVIAIESTL